MKVVIDKFNSSIFGMKMGNIVDFGKDLSEKEVQRIVETSRKEKFQHLNVKVPTLYRETTSSFLKNKFNLVDTQLMYCLKTDNSNIKLKNSCFKNVLNRETDIISYREYQESDKLQIVNIARSAYVLDQYHSDKELDDALCDNYYAMWIKNCCEGFSDKVMVTVNSANAVTGFLSLDYKGESAVVGLAAVEKSYQGKGNFNYLIKKTLEMLQNKEIKVLFYGTQLTNQPVLKTMGKFCGVVEYSNYVLHLLL